MDYLLDLLQGLGIAAAIGIRPFLPALLVGALAADNLGLDFGGTDFSFLESTGFLLAMLVLVAVFGLVERRTDTSRGVTAAVLGVIALALGALESAGSVADHSDDWWPGAIVGLAAAALAFYVTRSLLARVRPRLERQGVSGTLPLYVEGGA